MKPTNNRIYCIGSRRPKMLFETQSKADNFIKFNSDEIALSSDKTPLRSYYCTFCCGWHVTSVEDEDKAIANDRRDEYKWKEIAAQNRNKLPLTVEGQKISEMLIAMNPTFQKFQHQLLLTNLGEALELYKEIVLEFSKIEDRALRQKIELASIDRKRAKINFLKTTLDIIDEYDIDRDTRLSYLNRDKESSNELATNYFKNKVYIDDVEHLFKELDKVKSAIDSEEYKRRCDDIAIAIKSYRGKSLTSVTKEFHIKLRGLRDNPPKQSAQNESKTIDKSIYLSIIDLLEEAHKAVSESDFELCDKLIKKAEYLMPDSSDEANSILWNQIQILKDKLP